MIHTYHRSVSFLQVIAAAVLSIIYLFAFSSAAHAATEISTCEEFQAINEDLNADYILVNDVDCSVTSGGSEEWSEGFERLADSGYFRGTLDGQGYVVSHIMISGIDSYTGIFRAIGSDGVVENIAFTDLEITGGAYTAGVAGINQGTIRNVYTTGWITAIGTSYAAGIAGVSEGTISNTYTLAGIEAFGGTYAAGITNFNDPGGVIENSYAAGDITATTPKGISVGNEGTVSNSFWDTQVTGSSASAAGTGKTTSQMKTQSTFTDWDFENVWGISSGINSGYPFLQVFSPIRVTDVSSDTADGLYGVGDVIDIDVTFSDEVTSDGDVTVTIETLTSEHTCTFTIENSDMGSCNYTVEEGDATDGLEVTSVSGNVTNSDGYALYYSTPITSLNENKNIIIETTAPTFTVESSDITTGKTTGNTGLSFTVEFSETVNGFTEEDVSITKATIDSFTAVSGSEYTFIVNPTANGIVQITVPVDAAQDVAGNGNQEEVQFLFYYAPVLDVVTKSGGKLTIEYENGTTTEINPFNGNSNYKHKVLPNEHILVSNGRYALIYVFGEQVDRQKIGAKKLKSKAYRLKTKKLYKKYYTVVIARKKSMSVFRVTEGGKIKKKKKMVYENETGEVPTIVFKKKKKRIRLNFSDGTHMVWKLKKKGGLNLLTQ